MSEKNKELVAAFWSAFSESRFDDAFELLSDDLVWQVMGTTDISGKYSKAEFRELVNGVADNTNNGIQVIPDQMTAEGNRVSMEAHSYGEMKDGGLYQNLYHLMHEINKGKLSSVREYMDTEHVTEIFCTEKA